MRQARILNLVLDFTKNGPKLKIFLTFSAEKVRIAHSEIWKSGVYDYEGSHFRQHRQAR